MKIKSLFIGLSVLVLLFVSCETDDAVVNTEISEDLTTFVADEVLSDIDFADLLDEADDGSFYGDDDFFSGVALKSASIEQVVCFTKTVAKEEDKWIVTFEYTGDCAKSGTIIIEYYLRDEDGVKKKTITYIDFVKRGVTYNGTRHTERGNGIYSIAADMEIDKVNSEGDSVHIERIYERDVEWLCGLDTRGVPEDNIKTVTGKCQVVKTINGEEISYSREILEPLLIVKACDLRIQAGVVEINRKNGDVVTINYGPMPDEINCDEEFNCGNTFTVTIGDEVVDMEYVNGERVELSDS